MRALALCEACSSPSGRCAARFQQALQDGLIASFVGGIRNQSAPVLVYSVDGQRTLQGSVIAPGLDPLTQAILAFMDGKDPGHGARHAEDGGVV